MKDLYDPTDIQAQQRSASEQVDRDKRVQLYEAEDIQWVMANAIGRRLVWRLLDKAGLFRTSMTGNSHTFFNEGMRNFGIYLIAMINKHCPESYALMVAESKQTASSKETSHER